MARIDVSGADAFLSGLEDLVKKFPQLRDEILDAEADQIEPALRQSISDENLVASGILRNSIKRRKGKSAGVPVVWIGPSGEHHRYYPRKGNTGIVTAGYVGYVGEYGIPTRGIKGRNWLKKGIERGQAKAFDAADAVYDDFIKNNNV